MSKQRKLIFPRFPASPELLSNKNIGVIGNPGSGKTIFVRHMLYMLRDIPTVIAICTGSKIRGTYEEFIPPSQVFEGSNVSSESIQVFFESRERITDQFTANWREVKRNLLDAIKTRTFLWDPDHVIDVIENLIIDKGTIKFCTKPKDVRLLIMIYKNLKDQEYTVSFTERELLRAKRISMFSDNRAIMVFDDVVGATWYNDQLSKKTANPIYNLLTRGRHVYITTFFIMQSYKNSKMGSVARSSFQFVAVLGNTAAYANLEEHNLKKMLQTKSKDFRKRLTNVVKLLLNQRGGIIICAQAKAAVDVFDMLYFYKVATKYAIHPPPLQFRASSFVPDITKGVTPSD